MERSRALPSLGAVRDAAPQNVFLWVSKLTDGPLKCSGAPPSLGAVMEAALPRPTLAPQSVFFWVSKLTLEMLWGASKHCSCDGVSLAKAYPGEGLPWRTLAQSVFLWVSKVMDGPLKCRKGGRRHPGAGPFYSEAAEAGKRALHPTLYLICLEVLNKKLTLFHDSCARPAMSD